MKSQKDFRSPDSADNLRKAAKLEPIKKSGKERHKLFNNDNDDLDDEEYIKPKKESVLDYFDDDHQ